METLKFKTDIKCAGCVSKVTSNLNETVGKDNWEVDLTNPSKVLTITTEATAETIKKVLGEVGFKAEEMQE